ncbi:TFIIS helical bundle-like domain [Musa troglodytarum]|uniref:TFIIS helical bundle-like domain n=1 Tax=Musa troglodytarum TaxID=320322 RepID=A0A9E7KLC6_9LILI|nr:TFIIS helical bundle-like domain [Musa troglodytarum]
MWQVFAPGTETLAASSTAPPLLAFVDNPSSESDSSRCSCDSFLKVSPFVGSSVFVVGVKFLPVVLLFAGCQCTTFPCNSSLVYRRPGGLPSCTKGVLRESCSQQSFYSFHRVVISAASLLYVCEVAFLCKCVELPAGNDRSSFWIKLE